MGKHRFFLRMLSDLDEGVIIADRRGRIVYYNQTRGKIDDPDPREVLGKRVTPDFSPILRFAE